MAGAGVQIDIKAEGLERLDRLLDRLAKPQLKHALEILTAAGESQTRKRIEEGGPDPEGFPWLAWSPRYAKTRHSGQSLLQSGGRLLDSIHAFVSGDEVAGWGTNVIYGATHQFGDEGRDIPPRPYLGISNDDRDELEQLLFDYMDRLTAP